MAQDSRPARPAPGTRLVFRWRKWDGGVHWEHECVYLGADEWGEWFGQPTGWRSRRPGRDFAVETPNVTLLPPSGDFAATFNAEPGAYRVYIDIAWDLRWDGDEPTGVDMDLDVVDTRDGRGIWIDDRDEWDEHRVAYGYPRELVEHLEQLAVDLERRVTDRIAPYDLATPRHWLDRLAALGGSATDA
ncbi:DUF402 domain-containing protein [Microbacterium sp. SS28]|uniref:DUF402 domain-containing protein n=1 Tax=Microbacterium sp. SS28 TaxID=2919948 RepID=UPI001FAADC43|nr:DUF402 domain-containing protein [Microbacterium sp. SS28]